MRGPYLLRIHLPCPPRVPWSRSVLALPRSRPGWKIPALLALCVIPVVAGVVRLVELARGAVTADNARFFASPTPVVLHVVCASFFCVVGAFQFSNRFRRDWPTWHRVTGRVLFVCGLVAASTGLWMSLVYPLPSTDGPLLAGFRVIFGGGMLACIVLGYLTIRRGDVAAHRAWSMRGYAIGVGAGTQALVHLPWLVIFDGKGPGQTTRAFLMALGWVINLAVAEWVLHKRRAPQTSDGLMPK